MTSDTVVIVELITTVIEETLELRRVVVTVVGTAVVVVIVTVSVSVSVVVTG